MIDVRKMYSRMLAENPDGVLATRGGEGVRTRAFHYQFSEGNRAFFCTGKSKNVYKQIMQSPQVSFCSYPADFAIVLSINGEAVFVEDKKTKEHMFTTNPTLKGIYQSPDDPELRVFYIDVREVTTFSYLDGLKRYPL